MANELFDALCKIRISGEARQVLDAIIRKTYGYNKKADWVSLSQFSEMTGLTKPTVVRSLKKLISMNLIYKKDNGELVTYCLNKNYDTWIPLTKKITLTKKIIGVDNNVNPSLTILSTTKDNTTKDNTTKDILHGQAVKYFCDKYKEKIGMPYYFMGAKDGSLIKRLLSTYGFDYLKRLIDQLFVTDNEFITSQAGRSIGVLSACSNKLAQEVSRKVKIQQAKPTEAPEMTEEEKKQSEIARKQATTAFLMGVLTPPQGDVGGDRKEKK